MGMCLGFVTLGDENIQRVLEDPPLVWRVIAPDDDEIYQQERGGEKRGSFLSRFFGGGKPEKSAADLEMSMGEGEAADLDKAWHGIHYLLTGSAEDGVAPLNFLLCGGRKIGQVDVGYGPARALPAAEVREIDKALDVLSDSELRARFNPREMLAKGIYPEIWARGPQEDDTLGYLMEYVQVLRDFLKRAVRDGVGMVIYLA